MSVSVSFGQYVSESRKSKVMSQKELASQIKREDGEPISPQYLNDIEHDRRSPPSEIISQIAEVLALDPFYLHLLAKKWPEDVNAEKLKPVKVQELMTAFRKTVAK